MGEFTLPLLNDFQRQLLPYEISLVLNPVEHILRFVAHLGLVLIYLVLLVLEKLSHLLLVYFADSLLAVTILSHTRQEVLARDSTFFLLIHAIRIIVGNGTIIKKKFLSAASTAIVRAATLRASLETITALALAV